MIYTLSIIKISPPSILNLASNNKKDSLDEVIQIDSYNKQQLKKRRKQNQIHNLFKISMPKNKLDKNREVSKSQDGQVKINRIYDHLFRIYPIHSVFLKEAIVVNFQGKEQYYENQHQTGQTKSSIQKEYLSITPKFNQDNKYYTSSFILPYQDEESDSEMKHHHQNKISQSMKEIQAADILIPKPKSKNQYCAVCHNHYEDYLSHISTAEHKKNIKKSKFNSHIEYITLLVNEENKERDRVMTRSAKRKGDHLWIDYQLEDKANKKRKGEVARAKKSIPEKEEVEYQTPFNKRCILDTTMKSIFKQLD